MPSIGMGTLQNPWAGKAAEPPPSPNQNTYIYLKESTGIAMK